MRCVAGDKIFPALQKKAATPPPPVFIRLVEKIFRRNRKVCANRKEPLQRRKTLSIFNQVDVVHVLTERDAHFTRRNSLAVPQESEPIAKGFFIFIKFPLILISTSIL